MAFFSETTEPCGDCGELKGGANLRTDVFTRNSGFRGGEDETYCPACFVERNDGLRYLHILEPGWCDGKLVAASRTRGFVDRLSRRVGSLPIYFDGMDTVPLEEAWRESDLPGHYCREVARGIRSVNRNVYTSVSRDEDSMIDLFSYLSDEGRSEIWRKLYDDFLSTDTLTEISRKDDVRRTVRERYSLLSDHRHTSVVERRVWSYLKENRENQLSKRSRVSVNNQDSGRRFERFFEEYCEDLGIEVRRDSASAVRDLYPESYGELSACFGNGLPGIPDYFVESPEGQSRVSTDGGWFPDGDCFVEVKYGSSRLSDRQARMVPYLKKLGFDVYVLRGKPEGPRFEQR
ncbi:MAG: hypothetical protein ABEK59_04125 [Halobacteria archaeon]